MFPQEFGNASPEQEEEDPHCHQRYKMFPPGLECLALEGGPLSSPDLPLGEHYVHPKEGRPLPSKDTCRDLQHEQKIPIVTEDSLVYHIPFRSENVFARGGKNCRHVRLPSQRTSPEAEHFSLRLSRQKFFPGGRAATAAVERPDRSRIRVTGTGRLEKGDLSKNRLSAAGVVCKSPSRPGTFATRGRATTATRLILGTALRLF